ncbi:MAG TPA: secretin N-terminal domain-containing protein [Pirellulales bacterium]|nr:secretin N-terminal domain-containing protein [Pirellulales bacterium]
MHQPPRPPAGRGWFFRLAIGLALSGPAVVFGQERRQLERAGPSRQPSARAETPEVRAYDCGQAEAAQLTADLQKLFAPSGARIAADARSGQVIVVATPLVHAKIARQLGRTGKIPAASQAMPTDPATPAGQSAARESTRDTVTVPLARLAAADLAARLTALCGRKLSPMATTDKDVTSYMMRLSGGTQLEIHLHRRPAQVVVRGAREHAERCARLIEALDAAGGTAERDTRVVGLRGAASPFVRDALLAVKTPGPPLAARRVQKGTAPLLARMFQPKTDDGGAETDPDAAGDDEEDAALSGPVEIEQLEGFDAIIVRGSQRDVERVMQLVEEIERLSLETEPVVEVHHLLHVDSAAMADVIGPLYNDELGPRRGRVSITALVRPNALLLIGRKESVRGVIDLVTRLDQPGGPKSQFDVFRLRHATASAAAGTLNQFFAGATGLAPRVNITADGRTNALIVQASPRDLVEATQLIKRLDQPASATVNDLRVFRLRRASAAELADVLNQALRMSDASFGPQQAPAAPAPQPAPTGPRRGGAQGGQGGQGGQGAQGQPPQPQATSAVPSGAASQQAKSLMLRFLSVDGEGQKQLSTASLGDVRVTADTKTNSLLISAPAESMELFAALIAQLDQAESAPAQIKVFTLLNGDATSMTSMLEDLFQAAGGGPGGGSMGEQGPDMQPQVTSEQGGGAPLRFSVDARTNSIIATGSAGDLIVVEAILLRLDDSDVRERQSVVYKLKNSPAMDVALALNDYLQKERQTTQTTPGLLSPFEKIEREVVVVPEVVTNSLIVSATPRFFKEIERIVQQLDARAAMVMIQVLIAQVQLTNYDEFGIEAGLQSSVLFDRSLLSGFQTLTTTTTIPQASGGSIQVQNQNIIGANSSPGFDFNNNQAVGAAAAGSTAAGPVVGLALPNSGSNTSIATAPVLGYQGLSNFAMGRSNSNLGYGGLVLSLSSNTVNMLLRALRERDRLEILSRPQIMTLDNQPAFIQVGQRVPLVGNTTVGLTGSTTGVQYTPVGLIVAVTPRITPDGLVVMEIDAEHSKLGPLTGAIPVGFGAGGQVIRQPVIDVTLAQTTISALDGQTVVFGGLISKNTQVVQRRVPGISEVPVVGRLFRYDYKREERSELLIIMTPHVIRNERDADDVKLAEAARMSWCMADVRKIHDDGGLRNRSDEWYDSETPTIYPDMAPDGDAGQGAEPVQAPQGEGRPLPVDQGARPAPRRTLPRMAPQGESARLAPSPTPASSARFRESPARPTVAPAPAPAPAPAGGGAPAESQLRFRAVGPPARPTPARPAPSRQNPSSRQAPSSRPAQPRAAETTQSPVRIGRVRRAGYLADRPTNRNPSAAPPSRVQPASYDEYGDAERPGSRSHAERGNE